jgi:hypothetical protein
MYMPIYWVQSSFIFIWDQDNSTWQITSQSIIQCGIINSCVPTTYKIRNLTL